jgi:hypothetical protein
VTPPNGERGPAESAPVDVAYIAGIGRSGSTILCRVLGSVDGCVGTGELMRILSRGVTNGDLCGCGDPVARCDLWRRVLQELDRQGSDFDLARLERIRRRVTEGPDVVRYVLMPRRLSGLESDLAEYRRFLSALYRSIQATTGARVIVDASKNPIFGWLLAETPGLRVRMIHLVRDSRGYTHSLSRTRVRPGTNGRGEHFERRGAATGCALWTLSHIAAEMLGRRVDRSVRVRYEDFVAAPRPTVEGILRGLGLPDGPVSHVNGRSVHLGQHHLIASNPNREERGEIQLAEDLEWRRTMSRRRRWLVTGVTLPLLRRYYGASSEDAGRSTAPAAT